MEKLEKLEIMKNYRIELLTLDNCTAEFDGEEFIWDDGIQSGFQLKSHEEARELFKNVDSHFLNAEGIKHYKVDLTLSVLDLDTFEDIELDKKTIEIDTWNEESEDE